MRNLFLSLVCLSAVISISSCNSDSGNDVTGTQNGGNHNPTAPSDPSPTDGAVNVNRQGLTLTWKGSDPDPQDTVRYDVYAGVNNNPNTLVSDDQLAKSYYFVILQAQTQFYWKIVAKDNHGLTTDGPVWTFTTGN